MNKAHELIDQFGPQVEGGKRLTTWYAQGHSDGLGDRLLMFDNTSAPSWEILRFKPTLAAEASFEAALRQRVEQLTGFHHPAFPAVRPITELGQEDGLAVVSTYSSGVSLSEGLKKPRSAGFAVRLLRQVVPALAALQQHAPGLSHGALTVDRLVLTSEGRLMVREHMVGSALVSLGWSSSRLWAEFGILTPSSASAPALDARSDLIQLALLVMSLMRGRLIGPDDYPARLDDMLDELADRTLWHEPERFRLLRGWLERALQIGERPFESARDANAALAEIQDDPERTADRGSIQLAAKRPTVHDTPSPTPAPAPPAVPLPLGSDVGRQAVPKEAWLHALRRDPRLIRWAAAAVAVLAIGEAAFIGRLMFSGSESKSAAATAAATPVQPRAAAAADQPKLTPLQLEVAPHSLPPSAMPTPSVAGATTAVTPKPVEAKSLPAPSVRSGGFRIASPVEIHVLDGERVLGSSADGPIITTAGRHELDFVNNAIGYRSRRVVDVKPGQIGSLSLTIPNGSLNINATPWASVWIDGNPYGETPLGNVSVPPGEHEVVFRHQQFGERRERVIVRADTATRVTVSFK